MIQISKRKELYSIQYTVNSAEYVKLTELLLNGVSGYSAFLILLLKELDGNLNKALRILSIGEKSEKKIFPAALAKSLVTYIKEAIIMQSYGRFIQEDGFISIVALSKSARLRAANIDRQTIIRTFRKYSVQYVAHR